MKVVGVRELKDKLSEYLRLVAGGEKFLVTDHGVVVAELASPDRQALADGIPVGLADLAARGKLRLGFKNEAASYQKFKRAVPEGTARRLLDEDRQEK
jgi:antitoxin (DNA-binding transcriptional repressor) of toxin-antitoxin stability system